MNSTSLPVSSAQHQFEMRQEMLLESQELAASASQRDSRILSKLNSVLLDRDNAHVLLKTPLQKHNLAHQIWQRSMDKVEAALAAEQAAKSVIPAARTAVDVAHKKANDALEAAKAATALSAASAASAAATSTAILNGTHKDPYFRILGNLWLKHRHQVTTCAKASTQALVILQDRRHVLTHKTLVVKAANKAAKIAAEALKAAAHDVTQSGTPLRAARQEYRRLENLAKEMQQQRVDSLSKKKSAEDEVTRNKLALETAHATLVTVHEKIRLKAAKKAKRAAKKAAEAAAAAEAAEAAEAAAAAQATVYISIAERMKIRRQRQGQGQGPAKKPRY